MRWYPLLALPLLVACAGQSRPARMQEAAMEVNLNARFGRMELAGEHVAPQGRPAFFGHRKVWGSRVRIVDSELIGVRFLKDDAEAEAQVRIAWQPVDDGDMRMTTVKQTFKEMKNGWYLVSEERSEGDVGVFGEKPESPKDAPVQMPRKTKFDTIRLGQSSASPSHENTVDDP